MWTRRRTLGVLALGGVAVAAVLPAVWKWWRLDCLGWKGAARDGYGPLLSDPKGVLDLPAGFTYRILCRSGKTMNDGFRVPRFPDGMGVFPMANGEYRILRNHEVAAHQKKGGPFYKGRQPPPGKMYDSYSKGGVTTLVLGPDLMPRRCFLSLAGLERPCAGAVTPWGSWLVCEESTANTTENARYQQDHGYAFEVPATAEGLVDPIPLKAMGRFTREAAAVNPRRGEVYQTEDREDGCFYKFEPAIRGNLSHGKLSALRIQGQPSVDTSNFGGAAIAAGLPVGSFLPVEWVAIPQPFPAGDTLRQLARGLGSATFARAEGCVWDGDGVAFSCTSGGPGKLGQIWRYVPGREGGGALTLLSQAEERCQFFMPDSVGEQPNGDLLIAEDNQRFTRLIGITPSGGTYPFAYFRLGSREELTGVAFSPDHRFMVVNAYEAGITFLVRGPFAPPRVSTTPISR